MKYNNISISRILNEALNESELNEAVSDSSFIEPIRFKINIIKDENGNAPDWVRPKDAFDVLSKLKIQPEILINNGDGSGEICFPGKADIESIITRQLEKTCKDWFFFEIQ